MKSDRHDERTFSQDSMEFPSKAPLKIAGNFVCLKKLNGSFPLFLVLALSFEANCQTQRMTVLSPSIVIFACAIMFVSTTQRNTYSRNVSLIHALVLLP